MAESQKPPEVKVRVRKQQAMQWLRRASKQRPILAPSLGELVNYVISDRESRESPEYTTIDSNHREQSILRNLSDDREQFPQTILTT